MTGDERKKSSSGSPGDTSIATGAGVSQFGGDMGQNILLDIYRAVPRIEAKLEHLEEAADSTKKKVDDLTSWKNRVLGGVAVLAFLWAGMKLLSDYIHISIGSNASPAQATSEVYVPQKSRVLPER